MKKISSLIALIIFSLSGFSQPAIQWQKSLGGSSEDQALSIQQTSDGGYIVAGYTISNDGDVTGLYLFYDYWVVKLDGSGNLQWQKCLGGMANDYGESIQQTSDGGYIVAGHSYSNNFNVSGNHGGDDYWIVKLDGSGNIQWQKCLGGTASDQAYSIQQTSDGGYIVAGVTNSINGNVTGNHGMEDAWIVKLDGSGNIQWQKCLGGTSGDLAYSIQQTSDGGYIVTGSTISNDGDVTGFHGGVGEDCWIVKLDGSGNIQWQKCLGGTNPDPGGSVKQTSDGGYILGGSSYSNDGNVTGNHGDLDYWVVKLDGSGNIQWQKCLGGTSNELANSIQQTSDGGYIVGGSTLSNDGDVTGFHGGLGHDYWLVKLDGSGNLQWQKCLGGTNPEGGHCFQQTSDGGYIVAGFSESNDGDVTGNQGYRDYWIVKFTAFTSVEEEIGINAFNIFPNPATGELVVSSSEFVEIERIEIYSSLGEKIISEQPTKKTKQQIVDVSQFSPGLYFVRVKTDSGFIVEKFVKE